MTEVAATLSERQSRYGSFEDNAVLAQELNDVFLEHGGVGLSPMHREAVHMIFHKIARMTIGDSYYGDNVHDIIGYAKLLENYIESVNSSGKSKP